MKFLRDHMIWQDVSCNYMKWTTCLLCGTHIGVNGDFPVENGKSNTA